MANSKLLFSLIVVYLTLFFAITKAENAESEHDASLKLELQHLKSKILSLETSIDERTHELESKDEIIKEMEKMIKQKSDNVAILQSEIESLQRQKLLEANEEVSKVHARSGELEKQVDALRNEIEVQNKKKDALEARANVAEKKISELNSKLETLQKISDEQRTRIRKTERAIQVAEEKLMKAKLEATLSSKELKQIHEAWLPPWLALHVDSFQSYILRNWNGYGRPALDFAIRKAVDLNVQVQNWVEPHLETVQTKWIPRLKEHWWTLVTHLKPHVQTLSTKTLEVYYALKKSITPHIVKLQNKTDPYFQEAKKFTKPYINQISSATRPHIDKARVTLKPYTKKLFRHYKKFMRSATKYHRQVQGTTRTLLKSYEFTMPLATDGLVWFVATALLALPVIFLLNLVSTVFSKKQKRQTRHSHSHSHQTRRKAKRVHPDK